MEILKCEDAFGHEITIGCSVVVWCWTGLCMKKGRVSHISRGKYNRFYVQVDENKILSRFAVRINTLKNDEKELVHGADGHMEWEDA